MGQASRDPLGADPGSTGATSTRRTRRPLQAALDGLRLVLCRALLDVARGSVDEVLRLLQAETRHRAHDLDHLDLLVARAGQDDVERVLLLPNRGAVAPTP